jgi:class 3 adenylate cyclase/tetratricopeptide (TPR) repeat protein
VKCQACHHENAAGVKFCGECGARLVLVCPACGGANAATQRFCGECGTRLLADSAIAHHDTPDAYTPEHLARKILTSRSALEGERKQVTVLFCDIAGSTALAERVGAEAMHHILRGFFELALDEVHRYEGTINQFLGDGFMALFGAPVAHEDHARRAVLAALSIHERLKAEPADLLVRERLNVRTGIHTGMVVVGAIGDNLRMDYTAIGDTTNLAARLQQHAQPGDLLMSNATERLVHGYVSAMPLSPFQVKGKTEPVLAFELRGLGSRHSRLDDQRSLSRFVGRDRELHILLDAMADLETGRGQAVNLVGEPGVGKSRLVHELIRVLKHRNGPCLEGWCQSFGQSIPYLPLQHVLRAVCGIAESDTSQQLTEKVRSAVERAGLAPDQSTPYLLRLLGAQEGTPMLADVAPETIQARTQEILVTMVVAQSKLAPLAIAIEDLQWIDRSSEACLAALAETLGGASILLLTTSRPGYSPPWLGRSNATQVALQPLSVDASRAIVEATVDKDALSKAFTESILRKAEGNPLFLEELTLALVEDNSAGIDGALPDTIQGVLAARIDRLPDDAKRTLQTASVLGREFPLRLLEVVLQDSVALSRQLATLKQMEFLYVRAEKEGAICSFKHVLTQEVAYQSLLIGRREALHEAAARALESIYPDRLEEHCELIARHFSHSTASAKALDYLEFANAKARRANAVFDAKAHFEEAMRALDALPDNAEYRARRIALLVAQVHVFILTNALLEYERYLEANVHRAQTLDNTGLRGHFDACRGHCQFYAGRPIEASKTLRDAAMTCERAGNFEGAGHAYAHLVWSQLQRGEYEAALEYEGPALRVLDRAPNLRLRVYAMTAASWACANLGLCDAAIDKAQAARSEAERAGEAGLVCFAGWILAIAHRHREAIEEAIEASRRAYEDAPTPGDRAWAQWVYGWALAAREPEAAVGLLSPLLTLWRSGGNPWLEGLAGLALGEAYLEAGRLEEARTTLEQTLEVAEPRGMGVISVPARRLLNDIARARPTN